MEKKGDIVFCILMVLLMFTIPSVFALKDKYYNVNTKTAILKDNGNTIANVRLLTPHTFYVSTGYTKVAEFEIDGKTNLNKFIDKVISYDTRTKVKKNIQFDYKYYTVIDTKEVDDLEYQCSGSYENGTDMCSYVKIGSHIEDVYGYLPYDNSISNKKVRVALFTNVEYGDSIEWIPIFNGIDVSEWATYISAITTVFPDISRSTKSTDNFFRGQCFKANKNIKIISFAVNSTNTAKNCYVTSRCGSTGSGDIIAKGNFTNGVCDFYSTGFGTGYASIDAGSNFSLAFNNNNSDVYNFAYGSFFGFNSSEVNMTQIGFIYSPLTFYDNLFLDIMNITTIENISVVLTTPSNNSNTFRYFNTTFNCSVNSKNLLRNVSLWTNASGIVATDSSCHGYTLGGEDMCTQILTSTFSYNVTQNLLWNCLACDITNNSCAFGVNNYTINIINYVENSTYYVPQTTEGTTNFFSLNLTISPLDSFSSAVFVYNNTRYTTSINSLSNGNYQLYTNFQVPLVTSNVNHTFYWEFTLSSGTYNSTKYNQTVLNINLDNCSSYTDVLYNFTLVDEISQEILKYPNTNYSKIEIDFSLSSMNNITVISYHNTSINSNGSFAICIQGGLPSTNAYYVNALVRYTADGHASEFYNIQNFIISNTSKYNNITLYDLNNTISSTQKYKISYKNKDFVAVPNIVVLVQRYYVSEGVYKTVEAPMTNYFGTAYAYLDEEGADYNIVMTKNGDTIARFPIKTTKCQDILTGTCELNLNDYYSVTGFYDFNCYDNLCTYLSFNKTTRTFSVNYYSQNNVNNNLVINTSAMSNYNNVTMCSMSTYSSSGLISCIIPNSYGNVTFNGCIFKNGIKNSCKTFTIPQDTKSIYKYEGYVMMLLLLITIPFMFLSSIPMFLVLTLYKEVVRSM